MPMVLTALLLLASPAADRPRLPPVDQCAARPGFEAFRKELLGVIARKDVKGLLALTDHKVMLSFGGEAGHAEMRTMWELDKPATSGIWTELAEALRLGCAFADGVAIAPAMMSTLPNEFDAFETAVVVKPVTLRKAPDAKAQPIELLNWDVLSVDEGIDELGGWTKVKLKDGRTGFVRSDAIRSPIDYRALFRRVEGKWRLTALVAGD